MLRFQVNGHPSGSGACNSLRASSALGPSPFTDRKYAGLRSKNCCSEGMSSSSSSTARAAAVSNSVRDGTDVLHLERIVAVTTRANRRSSDLLRKLGFRFERDVRLDTDGDELELYAIGKNAPAGQ